jgi:hypothetical protein
MGWGNSPAYFCPASETTQDVTETLAATKPQGLLEEHPLEGMLLRPQDWPKWEMGEATSAEFTKLLEVYIDDFIQLAQTTDPNKRVSGHDGKDPVNSQDKLAQGDRPWALRKEILCWVFDGARRCIELPPDKVTNYNRNPQGSCA